MQNVLRISKHLIPVERIAMFEAFTPPDPPLRSERDFKSRIVLIDRNSILSEETPEQLAKDHGFRFVTGDRAATNPAIAFRVETFTPAENFTPAKPYVSRLAWTDHDGNTQSKLMLTAPEVLLAVVLRGGPDHSADAQLDQRQRTQATRPQTKRRAAPATKAL